MQHGSCWFTMMVDLLLLHLYQFHAVMCGSVRLLSVGYDVCVMSVLAMQS